MQHPVDRYMSYIRQQPLKIGEKVIINKSSSYHAGIIGIITEIDDIEKIIIINPINSGIRRIELYKYKFDRML